MLFSSAYVTAVCGQTNTSPKMIGKSDSIPGESIGKEMQSVGEGSLKWIRWSFEMTFFSTKWMLTSSHFTLSLSKMSPTNTLT